MNNNKGATIFSITQMLPNDSPVLHNGGNNGNDNNNNGDGGSSNMDKYATKEELKHTQELLSEKIDHRSDVIEEKIVGVKNQIESSNKLLYWILGIFGAVFTGLLVAILTK